MGNLETLDTSFEVDLNLLPEGDVISDEIAEVLSDYISDTTGFCHKGFSMKVTVQVSGIDYDFED